MFDIWNPFQARWKIESIQLTSPPWLSIPSPSIKNLIKTKEGRASQERRIEQYWCSFCCKGEIQANLRNWRRTARYKTSYLVYRNDTDENFLTSTSREDISATIQSYYQNLRNAKYDETDYARDKKVIDDPEMVPLESVDLFVTPHMQQGRIANEYMIEH